MNIAIVLVHNKGDQGNIDQISKLKAILTFDDLGQIFIPSISETIPIRVFQIIPFGVNEPPNLYDIDSYKCFYGKGDEDKTGNHPRFINYGIRLMVELGADQIIIINNIDNFSIVDLQTQLTRSLHFINTTWGFLIDKQILLKIGELAENMTVQAAITLFKARISKGGLKNG